jgi:predicted MPP superfamily phosphohydrolase
MTLGLATAGTTVLGVAQAVAGPEMVPVDIPLKGLPPAFDGFRIVQISDLHAGPIIGLPYVEDVVAKAMAAQPDLIVLTGDFVDGEPDQLRGDLAPLASLSAAHGVFYIPGNHEYYWGLDRWIEEFRALGATPLINEHRVVSMGDDRLVLAGIADLAAGRFDGAAQPDIDRALADTPAGVPRILLAHQPNSYVLTEGKDIALQLSGHTHAGQYFPFSLLIGLFHRYYKGLNRHGDMWVYVNRGTGFWGPPLRTTVPSEITLLTLRAA